MSQKRWLTLIVVSLIFLTGCVNKEKAVTRRIRILEEEANLALKTQNFTLAEQKMREILDLRPNIEHIQNNLAVLLAEYLNKPDQAIEIWNALLVEKPNNSAYLNNIAGIYWRKTELDKALEYYEKALQFHNSYYMPYYNMTHIYLAKNDLVKAEEMARKGYELAPSDSNMTLIFTRVLLLASKKQEVLEILKKQKETSQNLSNNLTLFYGRVLLGNQLVTEAESLIQEAIGKFPDDDLFKSELLEIKILKDNFSEDLESQFKAIDQTGNSHLQPWLTELYHARKLFAEGKTSDAIAASESLSGKFLPHHPYFEGLRLGLSAKLTLSAGNEALAKELSEKAFLLCPERDRPL